MAEFAGLVHQPVMAEEVLAALLPAATPRAIFLDATFGGGGHSRLLLERLPADCRLLALDCDEVAAERAAAVRQPNFHFLRRNYAELETALQEWAVEGVQAILFDLGVSSMQLDAATRGFSFRADGDLDMRMDRREGPTAAQWLQDSDEATIAQALRRYGEEPEARRLAKILFARRHSLTGTLQLATVVADHKRRPVPRGRHPATRVFQALRIAVNAELSMLQQGLQAACRVLHAGGRLAVIAFHSLEDRMVKRLGGGASFPGLGLIPDYPLQPLAKMRRPSEAEVAANPRARSACLRVFVKGERAG